MAEDLARAAMYALQALVGGLRESGVLTEDAIAAIERQTEVFINSAGVLGSSRAVPPNPGEAANIRHGMWWMRECVAPTANYEPGPVSQHPEFLHDWPKLGERWPDDE